MTMTITLNGEPHTLRRGATVADVVATLTTCGRGTAVARNGEVVPRSEWPVTPLEEADLLEILTAAQGG